MTVSRTLLKSAALYPDATGRWLVNADGKDVFLQMDTAWQMCHDLTREEVNVYAEKRQKQGFNAVLIVALSEKAGRTKEEYDNYATAPGTKTFHPNRYGNAPLENDDPKQPNDAYFSHVDYCIQTMIEHGMTPFLLPTWGRYINTGGSYGPVLFDEDNAYVYGEFISRRYPYIPKVLGGDVQPYWVYPGSEYIQRRVKTVSGTVLPGHLRLQNLDDVERRDTHAIFDKMAEGILAHEEVKPLLSYHASNTWMPDGQEAFSSSLFPGRNWLGLDAVQSGHADGIKSYLVELMPKWEATQPHVPLKKMWDSKPARPIIDMEAHYEDTPHGLNASATWKWNEHDIRAGAWQSVATGACGITYGANAIWQFYNPEIAKANPAHRPACGHDPKTQWTNALSLPGAEQLHIIKDYLTSLAPAVYHSRCPAQELLVSNSAPHRSESDWRVDVMRDQIGDGRSSWVIAHAGAGWGFQLDLSVFEEGEVRVQWLNPRDGSLSEGESVTASSDVAFKPPTSGCTEDDWVLVLTQ